MQAEQFSTISQSIPSSPGIYKYFDASNKLIYVGKAKNLKKRVSSYFVKKQESLKTRKLVEKIERIEFTIVNNEEDAFLLENTLIKEFKPKFNINLKDDKTYPFIVIKNEAFPRVFFTRRKFDDKSRYFGPYTSVHKVRELLEMIKENIPLRTCKLSLSPSNIEKKKFKVCLEYHLGKCKGPCEGLQSKEDYDAGIEQIASMLKGKFGPLLQELKSRMEKHAAALEFEQALQIQQKIEHLTQYQSRSVVANSHTGTIDVFGILEEGDVAYVHYLAVQNGSIHHTHTIILEKRLEEDREEILQFAIGILRQNHESEAKEIIVPFEIDYPDKSVIVSVPKAGDKKKLLELAEKNVNHYQAALKARKMLKLEGKTSEEKQEVLRNLQKDLRLSEIPKHIECFDNSNLHGTHPVSAMVCFRNGEPSRKEFRRYNIKTVTGINDFASMKETVYRRYHRLTLEGAPLPQLVIIDGGKGQLNAAMESIRALDLEGKMTLVGLAKNQEEIFFSKDSQSIKLPWNSESLKLIRRIRDEVHNTGIQFHRKKRSASAFKTELEDVKGIGRQTIDILLKEFKSINNIRKASETELTAVIGKAKAGILLQHFDK